MNSVIEGPERWLSAREEAERSSGLRSSAVLRSPPQNLEAERALLGAMLMNNRAYDKVSDYLRAEHFSDELNGRIFQACAILIDRGQQANPVTLKNTLERDDLMMQAGGIKYLAGLVSSVVTMINAADYGRVIHGMWMRRQLIDLGTELVEDAFDGDLEMDERTITEGTISALADLLTGSEGGRGLVKMADAVKRAMIRHQAVDRGEVSGVACGIGNLDLTWGLLQDGWLYILAGRPSMGKSALACTVAHHVALSFRAAARRENRKPKHVVVFSQEMTVDQNADRHIAGQLGVKAPRERTGELEQSVWRKLTEYAEDIADLPLWIDEQPRATLSRMRARCRALQRQGGVGLIVVDFLQIMGVERGKKFDGRVQELGYLVTGLKDLAKEMGCPLIALSQLSRAVEQRDDKRPMLSDLRESGDIEQAADVVGFVFREFYYLERNTPSQRGNEGDDAYAKRYADWIGRCDYLEDKADVIMAKVRDGVTGTAKLVFDGPGTTFSDDLGAPKGRRGQPETRAPAPTAGPPDTMPDGRPVPPGQSEFQL